MELERLGGRFMRELLIIARHSEFRLFLTADQREYGSLWVFSVDDPAAAGDLHRAVEHASSSGFDAFDGRVD